MEATTAAPAPAQSSGGGFLESIAPLALLAGLFAGGGKGRRRGGSGGGLLTMLMQQQAQEEEARRRQMAQDREYKMQLMIPMVQELVRQGYQPDAALLAVSKELGWDPTSMAQQSFEKGRGGEVRRLSQYMTPEQAAAYQQAQTYGDMNRMILSDGGRDMMRRAQIGDILAANLTKMGAAAGYASDPATLAAFQNDPMAALAALGTVGPNEDMARNAMELQQKGVSHAHQMAQIGSAHGARMKEIEAGKTPTSSGLKPRDEMYLRKTAAMLYGELQKSLGEVSQMGLTPEEQRAEEIRLLSAFSAQADMIGKPWGLGASDLLPMGMQQSSTGQPPAGAGSNVSISDLVNRHTGGAPGGGRSGGATSGGDLNSMSKEQQFNLLEGMLGSFEDQNIGRAVNRNQSSFF